MAENKSIRIAYYALADSNAMMAGQLSFSSLAFGVMKSTLMTMAGFLFGLMANAYLLIVFPACTQSRLFVLTMNMNMLRIFVLKVETGHVKYY